MEVVPEFRPWPKLSRWSRDVIITEKIDGTNACVIIRKVDETTTEFVGCQSRSKLITPDDDNYGFAKWAYSNGKFLAHVLGEGHHYGEWWGQGIQRNYGMKKKKFSLFNSTRWKDLLNINSVEKMEISDIGLDVVPVLWEGSMDEAHLRMQIVMQDLEQKGSVASAGYMNPEGIVLFHSAAGTLFKKTFENDEKGKG